MRIIILITTLLATYSGAFSQKNHEEEVRQVIQTLFDGMRAGDSSKVHSVFMPKVAMATATTNKAGQSVLMQENSLATFLKAVGTPHKEIWNEEIWNVRVQIDGNLAQAWCDYAFYVDNRFSHCGVDAFQLFKQETGWKIFHLADTRRKEPCVIPDEIQSKHK
jgi:hypothetical protein